MTNATAAQGRRRWAAGGPGRRRLWRRWWGGHAAWLAVLALGGWGCSLDSLLKSDQLPDNVSDPAVTETPAGALKAYYGSLALFQQVFAGGNENQPPFAVWSGVLSDELRLGEFLGRSSLDGLTAVDARSMPDGTDYQGIYGLLQKVRGQNAQSLGLLARYQPAQPALAGHLYALAGYSEVFLAELFCSGIPLSTLDYGGDYTLRPGSTTEEVFQHALALFDTAGTLAGDSTRIVQLAAVGKARALLGLGEYAAAAAAVAAVPDAYRYDVQYTADTAGHVASWNYFRYVTGFSWDVSVADQEGGNGLDYLTSQDPRSRATVIKTNQNGFPVYFPAKYAQAGSSPVTLASGVEARLIEAEAALQAGDAGTWFAKLNALRTDGTFDPPDTLVDTLGVTGCGPTSPCGTAPASNAVTKGQPANYPPAGYGVAGGDTTTPAPAGVQAYCLSYSYYAPCSQGDSMVVYTYVKPPFYHAGSGGVAGLAPLADPGTAAARVDLLFRERALWLFLTGHRQGDLRRLLRQYGRDAGDVYPIGIYPDVRYQYGKDVTMPIPIQEQISNPLFTGCASRGA